MKALACLVALAGAVPAAFAAEGAPRPPIIDVHLHAGALLDSKLPPDLGGNDDLALDGHVGIHENAIQLLKV